MANATTVTSDHDRYIAAGVLMIGGCIGLCVNIFVIYGVQRVKTFGESFGKICISQCSANCGNAAVFGMLVAPITMMLIVLLFNKELRSMKPRSLSSAVMVNGKPQSTAAQRSVTTAVAS
uniref:7TM_GPCR_Srx domain-containing protein n=2 Tax=Steinernema glaseri TaxID=37863 RepID=A0A1I8AMF1_9BILA